MDNTTQFNPTFPENESKPNEKRGSKDGLKTAGIAAGAAVAGAGASYAANHFAKTDDDNAEGTETAAAAETAAPAAAEPAPAHTSAPASAAPKAAEPKAAEHQAPQSAHQEQPVVEEKVEIPAQENVTPGQEQPVTPGQEQPVTPVQEQPVEEEPRPINPDENIPEIAEVEIDPTDYDGQAYVEFGEVAKVYNVDGSEVTMATAVTADGDHIVMMDIDSDEIFDGIADSEGNIISYDAGGMTVGDAEVQIDDNSEHIAYIDPSENEQPLPEGEDFMDDIIDA